LHHPQKGLYRETTYDVEKPEFRSQESVRILIVPRSYNRQFRFSMGQNLLILDSGSWLLDSSSAYHGVASAHDHAHRAWVSIAN